MKSICIITLGYPTQKDPIYAFIRPLVCKLTEHGIKCTVIAPQSITQIKTGQIEKRPYRWIDRADNKEEIIIYQPCYMSFSNIRFFGMGLSAAFRERAIIKTFQREKINADAIYGHFWDCGMVAALIGKKNAKPAFVTSGESKIEVLEKYSRIVIRSRLKFLTGLICVSSKNLEESKVLGLLNDRIKTIIIPNSYDPNDFYVINRCMSRESLGLPMNDIIGIYVGEFSTRKGSERVIEAAKKIPDLKLIMIGAGEKLSDETQVIVNKSVPHHELVKYLNAADFFVLPTLAEGCCNAIVEALACGLPIISSDRDFNYDILNGKNSILVNPEDISEITNAMNILINSSTLKNQLGNCALKTAETLTIEERTKKILLFMESNSKS